MKVITEGHKYELENFEKKDQPGQVIKFIQKEVAEESFGSFFAIHDGTTNEEILKVLINRMNYLQKQSPCRENAIVITKLEESLMWLEKRTRDRIERGVEGKPLV